MLCVVFKVSLNVIGSQREKLIVQKLKMTLDIISDHRWHMGFPAHRITHCRQQDQTKVRIRNWGKHILRKKKKLLAIIHEYTQRPLLLCHKIQKTVCLIFQVVNAD